MGGKAERKEGQRVAFTDGVVNHFPPSAQNSDAEGDYFILYMASTAFHSDRAVPGSARPTPHRPALSGR